VLHDVAVYFQSFLYVVEFPRLHIGPPFLPPEEPPYNEGGYGGQDVKNLAHRSADQEFSVLGGVVLDDREDPEVIFPAAAATEAEQRRVDVAVVFGTVRVVEELHLT